MSAQAHRATVDFGLPENIYGHVKRLEWIASHLEPGARVLEIGCGTGYMITLPLIRAGWDVTGVDTDAASIDYGRGLLAAEGLDPTRLRSVDAATLTGEFDAVILSEVLEHIPDGGIQTLLATVRELLAPRGRLFITVPNGYGWYELEAFLWNRMGVGRLLEVLRVQRAVLALKARLASLALTYDHPSSLDASPHVQRFTWDSVARTVRSAGFSVVDRGGTVLFAGQLSNLFFTGYAWAAALNRALGSAMPALASSFMIMAIREFECDRGAGIEQGA